MVGGGVEDDEAADRVQWAGGWHAKSARMYPQVLPVMVGAVYCGAVRGPAVAGVSSNY